MIHGKKIYIDEGNTRLKKKNSKQYIIICQIVFQRIITRYASLDESISVVKIFFF